MTSNSLPACKPKPQRVYLDLTHLGRHVTGIERIAIELFERQQFADAELVPVRSSGVLSMIIKQQIWLPLLAMLHPSARFVFPGFPPSVLFAFARDRAIVYVHDLFLVTRRQDLSRKAKLYMAWPFKIAVTRLRHFFVNSDKTRAELAPFVKSDASIALYRPSVRNVFDLTTDGRRQDYEALSPIQVVTVGTVEPRKNYLAAAAIVARMNATHPGGARLHIVGRAGWGPDVDQLAKCPHVTVHGFLAPCDVKSLIENASIYLCTSHDEGLGLPLLEVQYAGLPVVAPDQVVFREVLGSSAVFIDVSKPDEAAHTIMALLSKADWRGRATTAALANVARWNALASDDGTRAKQTFVSRSIGGQTEASVEPARQT